MNSSIRESMTKDLVTISSSQSIQEAAELMSSQNVGSIPVVDGGQVKGVITDRDITLRSTAQGMSNNAKVADIMSSNLVTGTPDMSSEEAAQLMASNQIRRLPIVENNQLVGYVALGDLATDQMSNEAAGQALTNISEQH